MSETASGLQSAPSGNSQTSSLGLPSADEIQKSIERLKEQMHGKSQETSSEEKADESPAADNGTGEPSAAEAEPEPSPPEAASEAGTAEGEGESGDDGKPDRRATLKETADRLKTSAKSLYEMEVPLNDGSGRYMSVEDLKAGYLAGDAGQLDAERHDFAGEKALHEKERIEHENRILQSRRELQEIMGLVTKALPADQLRQYQQQAHQRAALEAKKLVEMMPQFRDSAVYQGWMDKSVSLLGDYGFTQAEANNIADHRIYKVLDDLMRLRARVADLEAMPDEVTKPPRSTRRAAPGRASKTKQLVERAKNTGDERDKVAAARALIEGRA